MNHRSTPKEYKIAIILLISIVIIVSIIAILELVLFGFDDVLIIDEVVIPIPVACYIIYISWRIHVVGPNLFNILLLIGFIFHLFGDIFSCLADVNTNFFEGVLGCFLVGHVFNVAAFSVPPYHDKEFRRPDLNILIAIPFGLYCVGVLLLIKLNGIISTLDYVFVVFYAATFCASGWRAWSRVRYPYSITSYTITSAIGIVIFMSSDTMIGLTYFKVITVPEYLREILVLSTYWIGQGIVAYGIDLQPKESTLNEYVREKNTQELKYLV